MRRVSPEGRRPRRCFAAEFYVHILRDESLGDFRASFSLEALRGPFNFTVTNL